MDDETRCGLALKAHEGRAGLEPDHDRIWLEPKAQRYGEEGRMWCQDNPWEDDAVEYLRATPVRAAAPSLYEAVLNARKVHGLCQRYDGYRMRDEHAKADAMLPEIQDLEDQIKAALALARGEGA